MCLFVGEASVTLDDGPADTRVKYLGLVVQFEDGRETELLFVGTERTDLVTQPFGQHRDGTIDQIDRCGTTLGLMVDQAIWFDIVRHVGNVYTYFPMTILQETD